MIKPRWNETPLRYLRWSANEKPALFYSVAISVFGPAMFLWVPPLRRLLGDEPRTMIPLTYPIPKEPRNKELSGYDD